MLRKYIGRTLLILGFVFLSLPVYADTASYHLSVNSGSHLWIKGDSTLHKFKIETSTFNLKNEPITMGSPTVTDINTLLAQMAGSFTLEIPVQSLKDPEPGFNHNLWRDMKYKQYPNIVFSLVSATATPDPSEAGSYNVSAEGNLTIAGKQKLVQVSAVFDVDGSRIRITGTKSLLMSDYGIKPPTMFFGTVKTADEVAIPWDLSLSLQ